MIKQKAKGSEWKMKQLSRMAKISNISTYLYHLTLKTKISLYSPILNILKIFFYELLFCPLKSLSRSFQNKEKLSSKENS